MKYCQKCGTQCADEEIKCPKCGESFNVQPMQQPSYANQPVYPIKKKKKGCLVSFVVVLLLLIVIIIAISIGGQPSTPSGTTNIPKQNSSVAPVVETIKISAVDLLKAYEDNGVKADEDFKGKILEVTGIIKNIDKDILDDIYVTLGGGKDFELVSVQCFFNDKNSSKVSELNKGSEITIIGACNGTSLNVIMKKCTIK